jgi:hypothetical protein
MRSGLSLPPFDELADPALLARLAVEAEEAGWHGVFDPHPYAAVGATWWLVGFPEDAISVDQVRGVLRDGPADNGGTTGDPAGTGGRATN